MTWEICAKYPILTRTLEFPYSVPMFLRVINAGPRKWSTAHGCSPNIRRPTDKRIAQMEQQHERPPRQLLEKSNFKSMQNASRSFTFDSSNTIGSNEIAATGGARSSRQSQRRSRTGGDDRRTGGKNKKTKREQQGSKENDKLEKMFFVTSPGAAPNRFFRSREAFLYRRQ